MNIDNIKTTINLLKIAQNFNIQVWQSPADGNPLAQRARSVEELHQCGNSACIAGYVALSENWKGLGGSIMANGRPLIEVCGQPEHGHAASTLEGAGAMAWYWNINYNLASAIVEGYIDPVIWTDVAEKLGLPCNQPNLRERWGLVMEHGWGIKGMPDAWNNLTKEHAISFFEQVLERGALEEGKR